MESLDSAACFMDDLLDFSSDIGEEEDDDDIKTNKNKKPRNALTSTLNHHSATFDVYDPHQPSPPPFPELAEEELEWISNKDAFPPVEAFGDILSNPVSKHQSPVSVLENSNSSSTSTSTNSSTITNNNGNNTIMNCCGGFRVPARARSKGRRTRRRDLENQESWWVVHENVKTVKQPVVSKMIMGRKCQHCGAEKTPQWRAGPLGPKTLCNACGVRYKSGRLVPEYRPASSPTFSSELHSNSHRKVMEMRKQKQLTGTEFGRGIVKPVDKG